MSVVDHVLLIRLREATGLNQKDFAAKAGIPQSTYGMIEGGHRLNIGVDILGKVASALGIDPSELLASVDLTARAEGRATASGALTRNGKPVEVPKGTTRFDPDQRVPIPVLGVVPGGHLALVEQTQEAPIYISPELLAAHPMAFGLRVSGDSMSPRIVSGDHVVVDPRGNIREGAAVIVEVNGEVTLKMVGEIDGRAALIPVNNDYPPIFMSGEQVYSLQGVVVKVLREIDFP
jgi:repressor LexA